MSTEQLISIDLPSDEASRKVITDAVTEIVDSMTRDQAERELRKSIGEAVKEKTKFDPVLLNKFARWRYNGKLNEDVNKINESEAVYKILFNITD